MRKTYADILAEYPQLADLPKPQAVMFIYHVAFLDGEIEQLNKLCIQNEIDEFVNMDAEGNA